MAYVNLMRIISGNHVQEQFHYCLRTQEETTGSVDRKGQYDDADWFKDNPNRAGGTVIARTDATVAQYHSYIKEILTMDWAVSNRPAVEVSAFGYPTILRYDIRYDIFISN